MARYSNVSTNFSGGLVTDYLVGRTDLDRAANTARKFENFLPTIQGPAEYRPGFELKANEADSNFQNSVSTFVIFAADVVYRVVFGAGQVKIFNTDGALIDTVITPYAQTELADLRFSSETDELYITHPNHRPRVLSGGIGFDSSNLFDSGSNTLTTSDGFLLRTRVAVTGAGSWTINEIETDIEPFLEPDTSTTEVNIVKDAEIAKIVTTDNLSVITSSGSPTDFYIEYELNGKKVLGKVLDSNSSTNYPEVANPSVAGGTYTVYVDAVDFISEVTAPSAKLFLLDNTDAEITDGSITHKQLIQEGVPDDEVHLRSDVDIFNLGSVNTFIRVAGANKSNNVLLGEDTKFNLVRWVKVSEYIGLESHPVEFFRGNQFIEETSQTHDYTQYDSGSVYKSFGDAEFSIRDIAGIEAGQVRDGGNRVFVWNGGEFTGDTIFVFNEDSNIETTSHNLKFIVPSGHGVKIGDTVNISGLTFISGDDDLNGDQTVDDIGSTFIQFNFTSGQLNHTPTGDATLTIKAHSNGTGNIVGNLTTAKSFEVLKCDPAVTVIEYDGSINTGGKLVVTTTANTTITEVANDIIINSTADLFTADASVDRHFKGVLPSGMVYSKILAFNNTKQVRAKLNSPVPRNPISGEYENEGVFTEFSLGAWYLNNYPRTVAKYEQRRIYGGTYTDPNLIFFSRLGDEANFAPTQFDKQVLDTDGITYALSNVNASVRWVKAARDLVFGTSKGVFKLIANQFNAAVSPKTIRVELIDELGCEKDGVLAGTSIFFPDESGTELLEYKYDADIARDTSNDVSKFIYPTFVNDTIKNVVYQSNPQPRLWVLTDAGVLYLLTYSRQENYYAWSKHTTDGNIIDITVLSKGYTSDLDQVWITVKRGTEYKYERLFSEAGTPAEPTHYLDNATSIENFSVENNHVINADNNGVLVISASNYSNGDVISVVSDNKYLGDYTVAGGNLTVFFNESTGVTNLVLGKRYTGTLQMMYPTWNGQNKPAFGTEEARIISQKVFLIDSHKFKQGIEGKHATVKLPGHTMTFSTIFNAFISTGTVTPYTGFDRERPVVNSQFGVEKLPELVQDEPYKTVFGSLVTKTDLN